MAKTYFERRSLASGLSTYLQGKGWNITEVREGYGDVGTIEPPTVAVTFQPSRFSELQMGRDAKFFTRRIQIDMYMENESRATAIVDDAGDFVDEQVITVVDNNSDEKARMISITESIELEVVPPIMTQPLWRHWRGIIRAVYEVQYFND